MPPTTSNELSTFTKWDGSNETHDGYKTWMNEVSLWANNNDMAWIMKILKRLQEAPNIRQTVSRVPPLGEKFLDEAHAAREELLAEIQRSADIITHQLKIHSTHCVSLCVGSAMLSSRIMHALRLRR